MRQRTNPFYALLVAAGMAFTVTACAYGVMTFKATQPDGVAAVQRAGGLLAFLDLHGVKLMAGELAILGVATVGLIGTDNWWTRPASEPATESAFSDDREPKT